MELKQIKDFILDVFFPKICLICRREEDYLCQDCLSTLEIHKTHKKHSTQNLSDLYFALPYQNAVAKRIIAKFKYEPFIKELSKNLADIIITHFRLLDNVENFSDFILVPVPLAKKRLKRRGFNQAEEMAEKLAEFLNIEVCGDILLKTKETRPQTESSEKERRENIKGVFLPSAAVKNKKIILVDDVYTTGSTMEECAKVLRTAGAKEVIGIVVARARPEEDNISRYS